MKTPSKRITVTANVAKNYQETTAGRSKPEEHFRAIVERSANTTGQAIYSKSRQGKK